MPTVELTDRELSHIEKHRQTKNHLCEQRLEKFTDALLADWRQRQPQHAPYHYRRHLIVPDGIRLHVWYGARHVADLDVA
jgi:hypothetical protein